MKLARLFLTIMTGLALVLAGACLARTEDANGEHDAGPEATADVEPADGGADADGSAPTLSPLFAAPALAAGGHEIGVIGERVYWHFSVAGQSGIASGLTDGTAASVVVPRGPAITAFDAVGPHVVYQTSGGLYFITGGETAPHQLPGSPPCAAVTSAVPGGAPTPSVSSYVFCRTQGANGQIMRWAVPSLDGPVTLYSDLPQGSDLAYGTTGGGTSYFEGFYLSVDGAGIPGAGGVGSLPSVPPDGGASFIPSIVGQTNPTGLALGARVGSFSTDEFMVWLNRDTANGTSALMWAERGTGTPTLITAIPPTLGLFAAATTFSYNADVRAATDSALYYINPLTSITRPEGIGGIAVTSSNTGATYWTSRDARVYRMPR